MRVIADSVCQVQSFFRACLKKDGVEVPGSERIGHNVLVNNGREWLAELVSWLTIDAPDVANTNRRIRWIGVGDDAHLETEAVETLKNAVSITTGPDIYLAAVDDPPTFLSPVWVKFTRTLGTAEVSHSGDVVITEAGLYADVLPNPVLNGDFANWTTDDPDDWVVSESAPSVITERGFTQGNGGGGTGACNIYKGATGNALIQQSISVVAGRNYELHFDIGFASSGPLRVAVSGGWFPPQLFTTTGHKVVSFTAQGSTFTFQLNTLSGAVGTDFTVDNIALYPAGAAAAPLNALNPVVAYKAFEGLLKSVGLTLDLEWSFRF